MIRFGLSALFSTFLGLLVMGCGDSGGSGGSSAPQGGIQVATANLTPTSAGATLATSLTEQNSVSPVTWSVVSGSLPSGVTLAPNGVLSGTVGSAGAFNFRVRVTDAKGAQAERDLTLLVSAQALQWNPGTPFNTGTVGQQYGGNLNQSLTGGTNPITFEIVQGALPPGIVLDPATGALTGTPTAAGNFSVSIRATSAPDPTTNGRTQAEKGTFFLVN